MRLRRGRIKAGDKGARRDILVVQPLRETIR